MKQVTETFKSAIKSTSRKCEIKLEFDNGQTPLILQSDDIQEMRYISEGERELGGIETQLLVLKILKDSMPIELINTEVNVKAFIGVGNPIEWCHIGTFITDYWNKADDRGIIKVECVDILKKLCDKQMPFIPTMVGTTKKEYLSKINTSLGITADITTLHDGKLNMAMLSGTKSGDTIKPLLLAMNGLARGRDTIEYIPYKAKTTPQDTLNYNDALYGVEGGKDGVLEYDTVNVCVYLPSSDEYKEVAKLNDLKVPANQTNFRVGTITFNEPKVAKCVSFDKEVLIRDFNVSTDKISIDIDNPIATSVTLNVKVDGSDLQDTNISNSTDTTNKIKNIQNIYIQDTESISTLDTRIYTSHEIKSKYRGIPYLEVGDTIAVEEKGNVLLTYQELIFNGALSGTFKGVLISG